MMTWLLVHSVSSLSVSTNTFTFKASYKSTISRFFEYILEYFQIGNKWIWSYENEQDIGVFQVYLPVLQ